MLKKTETASGRGQRVLGRGSMTASRKVAIVLGVAILSSSICVATLSTIPSPSSCNGLSSPGIPDFSLSPVSPDLPLCAQLQLTSAYPGIKFTIGAAGTFTGSWVSTQPTAVIVWNASQILEGWPGPGPYPLNGSLDLPLIPGTYLLLWSTESSSDVLTITHTFGVSFDRGWGILQTPSTVQLPGFGYSAWAIVAPANASSFMIWGQAMTTACSSEWAVMPSAVFQVFQSNRTGIDSPSVTLLYSSFLSPCSSPWPFLSFHWVLPMNTTSGDVLVFFNSGAGTAEFSVVSPIEVLYLLNDAS